MHAYKLFYAKLAIIQCIIPIDLLLNFMKLQPGMADVDDVYYVKSNIWKNESLYLCTSVIVWNVFLCHHKVSKCNIVLTDILITVSYQIILCNLFLGASTSQQTNLSIIK